MYLDQPLNAQTASLALKPDPTTSDVEEMIFNQMVSQTLSEMEKRSDEIKEDLEKSNEDDA